MVKVQNVGVPTQLRRRGDCIVPQYMVGVIGDGQIRVMLDATKLN
jgi:hypothetical protein